MDYKTQEMYDFWMKYSNQSDWNQNVIDESYAEMSNCHTDLGFYCQTPTPTPAPLQNCHQQAQQCHQQVQQEYNYYEHTSTYYDMFNARYCQHYQHLQQHQQMSTLEGAATVQGQSINFQTSSLLDATQYIPFQMPIMDDDQHHQISEAKKQQFYCTACNMRFSRLYHLKRHFDSTGHKKCVAEGNSKDPAVDLMNYYKHARIAVKTFDCQFCTKKYKNKVSLKRHVTSTHQDFKNALWCQYNAMQGNVVNFNMVNC